MDRGGPGRRIPVAPPRQSRAATRRDDRSWRERSGGSARAACKAGRPPRGEGGLRCIRAECAHHEKEERVTMFRARGGRPPENGARASGRPIWMVLLAMLAVLALVGVTACGDDSDDGGGGGGSAATTDASADSGDSGGASEPKNVVAFLPTTAETYHGKWRDGAKAEAEKAGWTIKFIENDFSQTEQDVQVQQQLASGEEV